MSGSSRSRSCNEVASAQCRSSSTTATGPSSASRCNQCRTTSNVRYWSASGESSPRRACASGSRASPSIAARYGVISGARSPKSRSMLRPSATRTRISGSSASTPSQERTRSRNGQYVIDSPYETHFPSSQRGRPRGAAPSSNTPRNSERSLVLPMPGSPVMNDDRRRCRRVRRAPSSRTERQLALAPDDRRLDALDARASKRVTPTERSPVSRRPSRSSPSARVVGTVPTRRAAPPELPSLRRPGPCPARPRPGAAPRR